MPGGRRVAAVTDARFDVAPGECLALIGESGCGKSVLASALLGLLPGNARTAGSALLGDLDLLTAGERTLARTVRGRLIGLVPQSPAAHLTPVRTVRSQLQETVAELTATRGRAALRAAAEAAAERAAFPADHLDRHPHQLSGGLAQRAATALALVGDAPLLLADEPTTGLDRDLGGRPRRPQRGAQLYPGRPRPRRGRGGWAGAPTPCVGAGGGSPARRAVDRAAPW
ncbi:ATP-binding cassette domain-containing protein, partial [Streptomyces luteogriseus]